MEQSSTSAELVTPDSDVTSPESVLDERTLTCEGPEPVPRGGSDSGVELGAGAQIDGYASGLESLIGGAASTSCESSLLSFSGDLENVVSGMEDCTPRSGSGSSGRGRRTATPGTPGSRQSPTGPPVTNRPATARRVDSKSTSQSTQKTARAPRRTEARSASRGRTPPVSTDDGRWPSVSIKPTISIKPTTRRSPAVAPAPSERRSARAPAAPVDPRASTLDKYATLPRRKRVAVTLATPDTETIKESKPVSREPSLNRAASLRRQRTTATTSGSSSGYRSDAEDVSGSSVRSKSLTRSLPPYPRKRRNFNMRDAAAQTSPSEPRSREELEAELERLTRDHTRVQAALALGEEALKNERAQRLQLQEEAEVTAQRVAAILRSDGADMTPRGDWLTDIEARLQATSDVAARHQRELHKAQRLNRNLTEEVERARGAELAARQQIVEAQEEADELHEFLKEEKNMLVESLKEAEDKIASLVKQLDQKEKDIERQQEECRHLVRLSEQRRQETAELEAKVAATERYLVSQGGCTTAASVALAGLCSRLECLIPQLSSPKEEVEIFLNEAYAPSVEASPENRRKSTSSPCSPARSSQTTEELISQVRSPVGLHEEEDEEETGGRLVGSESLRDLTQAIISCHSTLEHPPTPPQQCNNNSLADQATELDQLVSKLLATFQNMLQQRERSVAELNKCRLKLESEHNALTEANSQLETQERRVRQLETAQRIAQQTGSDELSSLRERLAEKERQVSDANAKVAAGKQLLINNWRQAAEELRRQYEAIDKALEVLHKEQKLVSQSAALSELQRELEDTNFHCVSLPSPVPEDFPTSVMTTNSVPVNETIAPLSTLRMPETVNGTA